MISIDTLPDDALLEIFDHHMCSVRLEQLSQTVEKAWQSLVHVCRRWRCIVFGSPRRLDLCLVCTGRTSVRDRLDVWPALPLIIVDKGDSSTRSIGYVDNIVAALERTNRVCQIELEDYWSSDMEIFLAEMQQPFPELTNLCLWSNDKMAAVVPDSFLGGSALRLEDLTLDGFRFPGLPKLLLSATHLRYLYLNYIPHSGYISPDVMVTTLSTLTSLVSLELKFLSPRSCPDWASRRPPPSTRSVLPVLTNFWFKGVSEYLEDLVACIDAPRLGRFGITFFNDLVFDTPQLIQFISRTPKLKALENAHINLHAHAASIDSSSHTSRHGDDLRVEILCKGLDWQLSSLEQLCTSCLPSLSMLECLYLFESPQAFQNDNIDNGLWLGVLRVFGAVNFLCLSEKAASRVAPALQELRVVEGESLPAVLPTLKSIFLRWRPSGPDRPVPEGIRVFVAARQVAGHLIAVSHD